MTVRCARETDFRQRVGPADRVREARPGFRRDVGLQRVRRECGEVGDARQR